ncbi:hypothetical protein ROZALSC1DRAFT_27780 [Rozella allomycis CSF55]|uniref:Uncharacterized protein n=1 Tax=Rozella allomycis (strain CSF55) TaxID=988480 RepID=A0A075AVC0_ROZAC|nr:hypothetical protein O9G_004319 [Rozella allomycis CSF55]RKP20770.1 hypothetical protein ROZALSC1DRAFT_27780 [Rozella allomycis CSF55]|eukprot:EPZ34203.1 hypothetical protein O9G_004319 [Rozella allomycis CSF55]
MNSLNTKDLLESVKHHQEIHEKIPNSESMVEGFKLLKEVPVANLYSETFKDAKVVADIFTEIDLTELKADLEKEETNIEVLLNFVRNKVGAENLSHAENKLKGIDENKKKAREILSMLECANANLKMPYQRNIKNAVNNFKGKFYKVLSEDEIQIRSNHMYGFTCIQDNYEAYSKLFTIILASMGTDRCDGIWNVRTGTFNGMVVSEWAKFEKYSNEVDISTYTNKHLTKMIDEISLFKDWIYEVSRHVKILLDAVQIKDGMRKGKKIKEMRNAIESYNKLNLLLHNDGSTIFEKPEVDAFSVSCQNTDVNPGDKATFTIEKSNKEPENLTVKIKNSEGEIIFNDQCYNGEIDLTIKEEYFKDSPKVTLFFQLKDSEILTQTLTIYDINKV